MEEGIRVDQLLQVVLSGFSQGGVYALIGLGFSLVMMSSRILNLANGAFVMYGGFIFISLTAATGVPLLILVPLVVALVVLMGFATERLLTLRASPWRQVSVESNVLLTLALLVVFEGAAFVVWGPDPRRSPPIQPGTVVISGAVILWQSIWMLLTAIIVSAAFYVFLHRTWMGLAMRACAQSVTTPYLLGIDRRSVGAMAFGLSAAVAALAGVLVSPITWIDYQAGGFFMLKGLLAYLIGGEEDVAGPLVGGVLLGMAETFLLLVPGMTGGLLKQVVPIVILLIILLVRPQGILARRGGSCAR